MKYSIVRILAVLIFFQVMPALAQGGAFPWKSGDPPPAVAGIRLGDNFARLKAVLGQPSRVQKLAPGVPLENVAVLTCQASGLQVHITRADGVSIIYLLTRAAGDLGGVRVGDSWKEVLGRWGNPAGRSRDGVTAIYKAGHWAVALRLDQQNKVKQLFLGRATDQPAPGWKAYRPSD